jgi:hypothetical protein
MNVYIQHEELRALAEKIVNGVKEVTGYKGEVSVYGKDVNIGNWGLGASYTIPNTTTTTITNGIQGGTVTIAGTSGNLSPYNTTASTGYWSTYAPIRQPTVTIGPVEAETPPAKEHFEKMVSAQIQVLNEAYSLGREHGKLEGLKEGSEQITRTLDDIMDTDILEHEGDDSLSLAV